MLRKMMCAKIHQARVTQCDPNYVGSITIDANLLEATGIRPNEAVHVLDIDNANRLETYVIMGEPGSGIIGVNGAAAHLVEEGHQLIIIAYGMLSAEEMDQHEAKVVICNEKNEIAERLSYGSSLVEASK